MFKGKRFQDISTGKLVTVMDENPSWVTLDDSRNIKTSVFLQKFSEYLEAENFFSNDSTMESLAIQFSQQINMNTVPITGPDGSNISFVNPENPSKGNAPAGYFVDESQMTSEAAKRELLEKFQNTYAPPPVHDAIDMSQIGQPQRQAPPLQRRERPPEIHPEENETVIKDASTGQILVEPPKQRPRPVSYTEAPPTLSSPPPQTDDIYALYNQNKEQFQVQPRPPEQRPVDNYIRPKPNLAGIDGSPTPPEQPKLDGQAGNSGYPSPAGVRLDLSPEEEAFMFFRKFKKTHPIKIDVSFDEMIAEPDYVRQTAMNFDGDVIKFYTQELMKKIYADPTILEHQIYDSLKLFIMGDEYVKKEREEKIREGLKKYKSSGVFSIEVDDSKSDGLQMKMSEDMKKAAQTIGLDLVEVKPTENDIIEIVSQTFVYDDEHPEPPPVKVIDLDDVNPLEMTR